MIHQTAQVYSAKIGKNTSIWQFCVILEGAEIGDNCNICSHCFIERQAKIGNNVTIKCNTQIWDGVTIEDDVFIGANVSFTNDRFPRSKSKDWKMENTMIKKGACIGSGSTILPGITIGENAIVGAGSVVVSDVAANKTFVGNPAREIIK